MKLQQNVLADCRIRHTDQKDRLKARLVELGNRTRELGEQEDLVVINTDEKDADLHAKKQLIPLKKEQREKCDQAVKITVDPPRILRE